MKCSYCGRIMTQVGANGPFCSHCSPRFWTSDAPVPARTPLADTLIRLITALSAAVIVAQEGVVPPAVMRQDWEQAIRDGRKALNNE